MKINDIEIRELMRLALAGRIDKNDLTGTEKANILHFARQDKLNELEFLHRLVIANPKQNFEKLVSYSTRLKDCDILINWLEPYQQDQPQKKTPGPITYQWTKQADIQLPILHQKLIDGGFIASETSLETFTACFNGQPVKSITEKIKWLESKVLLAYFLNSLISLEKCQRKLICG